MKRHAFAFLSAVFGVLVPAATFAATTQAVYAYHQYGNAVHGVGDFAPKQDDGGQYWSTVTVDVNGVKTNVIGGSVSLTTDATFRAHPSNGWETVEWWGGKHDFSSYWKKCVQQGKADSIEWKLTERLNDFGPSATITACFEPITYRLDFASGGGNGQMGAMENVCYTNVFPLPKCKFEKPGWAFSGWSNSVNGATLADQAIVSGEILCISNAGPHATLTALWEEKGYSISTEGIDCTASANPASSSAYSGDVVISWTPKSQAGWTYALSAVTVYGGTDSSGTELAKFMSGTSATFNMSKAGKGFYDTVFIQAVYTKSLNAYSIGLSAGANGQVEKNPDWSTYSYGNQVSIRALADDGYAFEKWSDGSADAERLLIVTNDVTLKATFTNRVYTLTFDPNGGTVVGVTNRQVKYNDYIGTLPSASQPKKQLYGWHRDPTVNSPVFGDDRYTWTENKILYAHWIDAEFFSVTVTVDPPGSGDVSGDEGPFEKGDRTTLEADPQPGYSFCRWNDDVTSPTRELEVVGNMAFTAFFTGNVYKVKFDLEEHKGTVSPTTKDVTFNQPYGALPTPVFDDPDIRFECWTDDDGATISESSTFDAVPTGKYKHLYARASIRPHYFVAFVGGSDATGEMDVQKIYRDEVTSLTSNAFVRTGHSFRGWAETNDLSQVKYADGTNVYNIAAAGATNELHAVWQANRYVVAFDGNGATDVAMEPQAFTYGKPQNLSSNTYDRGELWSFVGWSNTVDGTVFTDGVLVSNLCTVADGTNTLLAIWRSNLTDLSRAMKCDNLIWIGEAAGKGADWVPTETGATVRAWYDSLITGDNQSSYMAATGTVSGTLSFHWTADVVGAVLELRGEDGGQVIKRWEYEGSAEGQESSVLVELPPDAAYQVMRLRINYNSDDFPSASVRIDRMTWTPHGSEPPGSENAVEISSVAVSDGKFTLSFPSDARFDYNLLTNANLLIDSWGKMGETKEGTGEEITFEPEIIEGLPQLFYKVETIQKK